MKSISTEISIKAPRIKVWEVLTDFNSYPDWNPFIREVHGELGQGNYLEVTMEIENRKPTSFKPVLIRVTENENLCWKGKLFVRGLFDGTHYFNLEDLPGGETRLIHGEYFSGLLAGSILRKIEQATAEGFRKMNEALKSRIESGNENHSR